MEKRKTFKPVPANVDFYSGFVYSMLGLPTETYEDVSGIADLAQKVVNEFYRNPDKPKGKINPYTGKNQTYKSLLFCVIIKVT